MRSEITADRLRGILRDVLPAQSIASVERVEGGLTNAVFRVRSDTGCVAVRFFAGGEKPFRTELAHLTRLRRRLPVPEPLASDGSCAHAPLPFIVYPWIDGMTLNAFRRAHDAKALDALAAPLGALATAIASAPARDDHVTPRDAGRDLDAAIEHACVQLREDPARSRLGEPLARQLCLRLEHARDALVALDDTRHLVHGDLGGRNILVAPDVRRPRVVGLLDWERAHSGSRFWDIGSLFRYGQRYTARFVADFEAAYIAAGMSLPHDWLLRARLLDAIRLAAILSSPEVLPVFDECRDLVAQLLADGA